MDSFVRSPREFAAMSFFSRAGSVLALVLFLSCASFAQAGWRHHACHGYLRHCHWHCAPGCLAPAAPCCLAPPRVSCAPCVTRTYRCEPVYATVPRTTWTTHYDLVQETVARTCYRTETRERPVTTYRTIGVPQQVTRTYTVSVPEVRTAVRQIPQVRTFTEYVNQPYTVAIPQTEMRTGYRTAVRVHHDVAERMVCRQTGHWEESCEYVSRTVWQTKVVPTCGVACADFAYASCCGVPCGHFGCHRLGWRHACGWHSCGHSCVASCEPCYKTVCEPVECGQWVTRRNWVPETVWVPVKYSVCRYETYQVPYTYPVTTCRYETRTRQVPVTRAVTHYVPQTYSYTVYRPEVRTRVDTVMTYRQVPTTVTQTYTVSIPYVVHDTVDRIVCKSVPTTTYECVIAGYRTVACDVVTTVCSSCE